MFWVLITLLKVLKALGDPRLGPLCCSVPAGACERPRTTMLSPEAEAHHVPRRTAYRWAAGSRDRGRGADRADRADPLSAVRGTLPSGCTVVGSARHPCTYCTPASNFPRAGGGRVRPVRPVRPRRPGTLWTRLGNWVCGDRPPERHRGDGSPAPGGPGPAY